jgi:nicotinate-nucleotide pyrophosphorylase (carboxylating)
VSFPDRFGFPVPALTDTLIRAALTEDFPGGIDLASAGMFDSGAQGEGAFEARAPGLLAGGPLIARVLSTLDPAVAVELLVGDGERVAAGQVFARARGPVRALLGGERTVLNLVARLSGIATLTARYVEAVAGTGCRIADTRKTTPGLRVLEKYAVRAGGGSNHRMSLSDAAMVKDNHLAACRDPAAALARLKRSLPHTATLTVEATSLEQARMAAAAGADVVLLDNMAPEEIAVCVRELAGRVTIEASGGITLETAGRVAATGVNVISVGALTHSARALDMSFELAAAAGDG